MGLSMKGLSMKEQLTLLVKLLPEPYMHSLHDKLVSGDIKLETKFFNLAFYWGDGKVVAANMPLSTPNLMNMDKTDPALGASKFEMLKLYKELADEYNKSHPASFLTSVTASDYTVAMNNVPDTADSKPKTKPMLMGKPTLQQIAKNTEYAEKYGMGKQKMAEMIAEKIKMAEAEALSKDFPKPTSPLFADGVKAPAETKTYDPEKMAEAQKILDGAKKTPFINAGTPIRLQDATVLGQRVKGTSPDSKYFLIAKKGGIKLAMRNVYKHGTVSFRAEFLGVVDPHTMQKLKDAGMTFQQSGAGGSKSVNYASIHLTTTNQEGNPLPLGRIVGSFLMGMGIEWEEMIMNPNEVPEDKP